MIPPRIVPLPPDHVADLTPFLAMIRQSGWLALALVASVVAAGIWWLLGIRRRIEAETSLHLLVNCIAAISALVVVALGIAALEILTAPAVALQALFHVECLPTDRIIVTTLVTTAMLAFICETRWRRHRP
jgi:hypothetical protein